MIVAKKKWIRGLDERLVLGAVKVRVLEEHLFGLSRCTVCRYGAAHIAPSAAALGRKNIYLAFIGGETLAEGREMLRF